MTEPLTAPKYLDYALMAMDSYFRGDDATIADISDIFHEIKTVALPDGFSDIARKIHQVAGIG